MCTLKKSQESKNIGISSKSLVILAKWLLNSLVSSINLWKKTKKELCHWFTPIMLCFITARHINAPSSQSHSTSMNLALYPPLLLPSGLKCALVCSYDGSRLQFVSQGLPLPHIYLAVVSNWNSGCNFTNSTHSLLAHRPITDTVNVYLPPFSSSGPVVKQLSRPGWT